jgi:hypothetical protein
MAKKRGGIAGFYDRNKGIIQKAVPAALSFIPGAGIPLAAGAGALMRGLDRPGQRGIGFNAFEGLKGGVEGALVGAGTQGVRAMLTGGGPLAGMVPKVGGGMGGGGSAAETAARQLGMPLSDIANAGKMAGTGSGMGFTQALLQPQVLSGAVQGGLSMLPDAKSAAMEEQTKLGQGQLALQQAQFEEEKRRAQMEEERRRKIAELLMPYVQQQYGSYFGGR